MKNFLDNDFLLQNETGKVLYHDYAKDMPIIDYHCHINPAEIAENKKYKTITEVWLGGDHYKWRAMRMCSVEEKFITGDAGDYEKFSAYAKIMPLLIGNPLYHWTHLELRRYFNIDKILCEDTAKEIYDICNEKLQNMTAESIIKSSNVEVICTTDDPDDTLKHHKKIAELYGKELKVLPTFRPDRLFKNNEKLSHIEKRLDFFVENGCVLSDHGISVFDCGATLSLETAKLYKERNITMQLHFGVIRNANSLQFSRLGADSGFDCMGDFRHAEGLVRFLDSLDKEDKLPRTILYSINPNDNIILDTISGSFREVRHGAAWWFNDTKPGMEQHLIELASAGALGKFLGMLTDSRSFLSYTRHEYFRRILCNFIGNLAENGEYPNDRENLSKIIKNICYFNSKNYLGL